MPIFTVKKKKIPLTIKKVTAAQPEFSCKDMRCYHHQMVKIHITEHTTRHPYSIYQPKSNEKIDSNMKYDNNRNNNK